MKPSSEITWRHEALGFGHDVEVVSHEVGGDEAVKGTRSTSSDLSQSSKLRDIHRHFELESLGAEKDRRRRGDHPRALSIFAWVLRRIGQEQVNMPLSEVNRCTTCGPAPIYEPVHRRRERVGDFARLAPFAPRTAPDNLAADVSGVLHVWFQCNPAQLAGRHADASANPFDLAPGLPESLQLAP